MVSTVLEEAFCILRGDRTECLAQRLDQYLSTLGPYLTKDALHLAEGLLDRV